MRLWGLLVVAAGCAPAPPPVKSPAPLTLAVIEFGDSGREAERGCVMAALEAGYRVVGRRELDAQLPNDEVIDYRALGRGLGADMVIDGGLARGMKARRAP